MTCKNIVLNIQGFQQDFKNLFNKDNHKRLNFNGVDCFVSMNENNVCINFDRHVCNLDYFQNIKNSYPSLVFTLFYLDSNNNEKTIIL